MAPRTTQQFVETALTGTGLLTSPILNKGTAFTEAERDTFSLHGMLPPLESLRDVSVQVALAVGRQAAEEGLAAVKGEAFAEAVRASIWEPIYLPYKKRK